MGCVLPAGQGQAPARQAALAAGLPQGVMVLAFVSGGVGVIQHFLANLEYAAESDPSLSGKALYLEAIWGSTPALAPGTMVQLALLGLAFTFRHPRLRRRSAGDDSSSPKDRS
jgi:hypothetical protein